MEETENSTEFRSVAAMLPGESREEYWARLTAEARADPEWAEAMDRGPLPQGKRPLRLDELEPNPEWDRFGFRGQVAKRLFEHGLKRKAIRFANCGRLGRPGVCSRYPFEHKYFVAHGCSVIFCSECGPRERRRLFADYLHVIREVVCERAIPDGWVLARINFTLWSDGSEIEPEKVKKSNGCVRRVMRKTVGSSGGFGMLFIDEVGFEKRGHTRRARKAKGLNLHCHGLYFGPRLDWQKTRDLWAAETRRVFGVQSLGFWITSIRGLRRHPEKAVRHALNHMLKYVSKPPAVTPERLTSLVAAFDHTKRVHSLGLFYAKKPKRKNVDCPCPKCRMIGVSSIVSFEGRLLPNGGCIPRLVRVEDLREQGYELLKGAGGAGQASVFGVGLGREVPWRGPP